MNEIECFFLCVNICKNASFNNNKECKNATSSRKSMLKKNNKKNVMNEVFSEIFVGFKCCYDDYDKRCVSLRVMKKNSSFNFLYSLLCCTYPEEILMLFCFYIFIKIMF